MTRDELGEELRNRTTEFDLFGTAFLPRHLKYFLCTIDAPSILVRRDSQLQKITSPDRLFELPVPRIP